MTHGWTRLLLKNPITKRLLYRYVTIGRGSHEPRNADLRDIGSKARGDAIRMEMYKNLIGYSRGEIDSSRARMHFLNYIRDSIPFHMEMRYREEFNALLLREILSGVAKPADQDIERGMSDILRRSRSRLITPLQARDEFNRVLRSLDWSAHEKWLQVFDACEKDLTID